DAQPRLSRGEALDVEDVRDELALRERVAGDGVDRALAALGVQAARLQEVGPGDDRVERAPQLVGDRGEELVPHEDGALGLTPRGLLALQQSLALDLAALALAGVARDLGGADDRAAGIPDRRHRDRDVDEPAILRL